MRTPSTGMPGVAHRRDDEPAAARRRPDLARRGGELLEQHLGVEVVALVVHVADDRRPAGRRRRRRATPPSSGATPRPGPPDDRDAAADERVAERPRGEQRRRERRPAAGAVDDEGRERRRLAADEVRLPARGAPLRVVERLVAEDASRSPSGSRARGSSPRGGRGRPSTSVGSPKPLRTRSPSQAAPARVADAVDLGVEPVARPEAASARPTRRGSSRSTPARRRATALWAKTTSPVVTSTARAEVRRERERRAVERLRQLRLERRGPGGGRRRRRGARDRRRTASRSARRLTGSTVDR